MIVRAVLLNLLRLFLLATLVGLASAGARPAHAAMPVPGAFAVTLEGQINLNTATAVQLELLPGVGPATAAKIIAYRERRPFRSPRQLMRIKGIGPKRYEAMRPFLAVEGETTLRPASP